VLFDHVWGSWGSLLDDMLGQLPTALRAAPGSAPPAALLQAFERWMLLLKVGQRCASNCSCRSSVLGQRCASSCSCRTLTQQQGRREAAGGVLHRGPVQRNAGCCLYVPCNNNVCC